MGKKRKNVHVKASEYVSPYQGMQFSFKYLDLDSDKAFSIDTMNITIVKKLFYRLKEITGMAFGEFSSSGLNVHPIDWCETTRKKGFKHLNEQLWVGNEWQFSVLGLFRVHGFLIDDMFHIVWLDEQHSLYKKK